MSLTTGYFVINIGSAVIQLTNLLHQSVFADTPQLQRTGAGSHHIRKLTERMLTTSACGGDVDFEYEDLCDEIVDSIEQRLEVRLADYLTLYIVPMETPGNILVVILDPLD